MKAPTIHISKGNSKTGAIPSFSLPSGLTCSEEACKTCYTHGCYAKKIERLRPIVRESYAENLMYAKDYPEMLESYLNVFFSLPAAPRFFRLHISGDFFSTEYFEMWMRIISSHPGTRFLAFTKQERVVKPYVNQLPKNFSLVWSAWPGVDLPDFVREGKIPVAWMQDGTETRIPEDAVHCPGHCDQCAKCWALNGRDTVFKKH